jgi:tRNA nucleotidyltransferase (CCA-adding enzyme)
MSQYPNLNQYFLENTNNIVNQAPAGVTKILDMLMDAGFECYIVGGAVRDLLLGHSPKDWDLVTNASFEELQGVFPNAKPVGAAFGVALVKMDGIEAQVARYRSEKGYSDFRHPDKVDFVSSLSTDLQRRDFTVNALAVSRSESARVENTLEDLNDGVIRAIGDPNERFMEDPLRMLRAIRLAAKLGFGIHQETWIAIKANIALIRNISAERIREEFDKILLTTSWGEPRRSIEQMRETGLLRFVAPELDDCYRVDQNFKWHCYDVYYHQLEAVMEVKPELTLRLAALFHDLGKPYVKTIDDNGHVHFYQHELPSVDRTRKRLMKLNYDNKTIEEVIYLVRHHMGLVSNPKTDRQIRRLLSKHGYGRLLKLVALRYADRMATGKESRCMVETEMAELKARIAAVNNQNPPVKHADLAVDGNDIMNILGIKPGKEVGIIKDALLDLVLSHPEMNIWEILGCLLEFYKTGSIKSDSKVNVIVIQALTDQIFICLNCLKELNGDENLCPGCQAKLVWAE